MSKITEMMKNKSFVDAIEAKARAQEVNLPEIKLAEPAKSLSDIERHPMHILLKRECLHKNCLGLSHCLFAEDYGGFAI